MHIRKSLMHNFVVRVEQCMYKSLAQSLRCSEFCFLCVTSCDLSFTITPLHRHYDDYYSQFTDEEMGVGGEIGEVVQISKFNYNDLIHVLSTFASRSRHQLLRAPDSRKGKCKISPLIDKFT